MNGSAITFATDAERIAFHVELETEGERSPCQVDAALANAARVAEIRRLIRRDDSDEVKTAAALLCAALMGWEQA